MERRNIRDCRVGDFILDRHPGPKTSFVYDGRAFRLELQTVVVGDRTGTRTIVRRYA